MIAPQSAGTCQLDDFVGDDTLLIIAENFDGCRCAPGAEYDPLYGELLDAKPLIALLMMFTTSVVLALITRSKFDHEISPDFVAR